MTETETRREVRRVLLAVEHARNRDVLRDWIERDPGLAAGDEDDFDVVVFDGPAFARRRDWLRDLRARVAPLYVPCLLTTPHREVSLVTAGLWRDVDDLITTPIRSEELRVRIERLVELRRRSEAIAHRVDELGRSNADLQEFAFVAAHELSTPLTVVTGAIETVNALSDEALGEDVGALLAAARNSSRRLLHLVEDLLAYARAGYRLDLRRVQLASIVETSAAELAGQFEQSGGTIEVGPLPEVLADEAQLRLVFTNLIANALKYARPHVPPVVRISAARDGAEWLVDVVDNGIGIDLDRAEGVFAMFERERPEGDRPGHGIGLALCRRVLERHGGRIWIEPTPGGGTTVRLTLRAAE
jgi:signal transduction histidine kinase